MGYGGKAVRAARLSCGASLSAVVLAACNPGAFDGLPRDRSSSEASERPESDGPDTPDMLDAGMLGVDAAPAGSDQGNPPARDLDAAGSGAQPVVAPDSAAADGGIPMPPGLNLNDAAGVPVVPEPGGHVPGMKDGGVVGHNPQSDDGDGSV